MCHAEFMDVKMSDESDTKRNKKTKAHNATFVSCLIFTGKITARSKSHLKDHVWKIPKLSTFSVCVSLQGKLLNICLSIKL